MSIDTAKFEANTLADGYSPASFDADQFVAVPNLEGLIDYGHMPEEVALRIGILALPIRLLNGRHFANRGTGYGVAHIKYQRASELADLNYHSVQDFVDDVAYAFDAVHSGKNGRHIVLRRSNPMVTTDRILVLELSKCKTYYSVLTGYPVSKLRNVGKLLAEKIRRGNELVWECRAPHSIDSREVNPTSKAG